MATKWIYISLVAYPVKVLGIGERVGIWTQGCSIRCKGCMSKHTWEFDNSKNIKIDTLLKKLSPLKTKKVTISGGEPFEQKEFLFLLKGLRELGFDDILVYSGYEKSYIFSKFKEHLKYIDVLICGKFIQGYETNKIYKGSKNQKMVILNNKLKLKYLRYKKLNKTKKLQQFGNIIVGIPYQKDIK